MSGNKHPILRAFESAVPTSLPVMAGYLVLGSGYGVLMQRLGYGPGWTVATSVLVFGGTIQYIATTLLAAGFQPLYALVVSLTINARHLFYGFSMLERYAGAGWKKPFMIFWLTDETFSLVVDDHPPPGVDRYWRWWFISLLDYLYWIAGGLIGNVAGSLLAFDARGIEFVMTALFTVIVTQQWREGGTKLPALIGFAASAACVWLFGPGMFVIPAMAGIVALLLIFRKRIQPPPEGLA